MRLGYLLAVTFVLLCRAVSPVKAVADAPPRYTITTLGDAVRQSDDGPVAINDNGDVAGTLDKGNDRRVAFLYHRGTMTELGTLGGQSSEARGLNDRGQIVGMAQWDSGARGQDWVPFLWQRGRMRVVTPLPSGLGADVPRNLTPGSIWGAVSLRGIDDAGQVVGSIYGAGGALDGGEVPFVWQDSKLIHLHGPSPKPSAVLKSSVVLKSGHRFGGEGGISGFQADYSVAAISSHGWMVGNPAGVGGPRGGFDLPPLPAIPEVTVWTDGIARTVSLPGVPKAFNCDPTAINNRGQFVGTFFVPKGGSTEGVEQHGFFWDGKTLRDLTPSGNGDLMYGLNDSGEAVGTNGGRPFLWRDAVPYDLNTVIPVGSGWVLQTARAINNRGQIVSVGVYHGQPQGFLLTPLRE